MEIGIFVFFLTDEMKAIVALYHVDCIVLCPVFERAGRFGNEKKNLTAHLEVISHVRWSRWTALSSENVFCKLRINEKKLLSSYKEEIFREKKSSSQSGG